MHSKAVSHVCSLLVAVLGTNSVEALTLAANKDYFNVRRQARAKRELWMKRLIDRHRELANIERPHMSEINSEELFTYK